MSDFKKALTSIDISLIVAELQVFIDGYIEKIYEDEYHNIYLKIKTVQGSKGFLVIRVPHLLGRIDDDLSMPETPTEFVKYLRKIISDQRIVRISQAGFDRVVTIELNSRERKKIILEFFGTGNMLITDAEQRLIYVQNKLETTTRKLLTGEIYKYPQSKENPFTLGLEELTTVMKSSTTDIVRTLVVKVGLPPEYSEELCLRIGEDKNRKISECDDNTFKKIYDELQNMKKELETPIAMLISESLPAREEFTTVNSSLHSAITMRAFQVVPIKFKKYSNYPVTTFPTYSEAIITYFLKEYEAQKHEDEGKKDFTF